MGESRVKMRRGEMERGIEERRRGKVRRGGDEGRERGLEERGR